MLEPRRLDASIMQLLKAPRRMLKCESMRSQSCVHFHPTSRTFPNCNGFEFKGEKFAIAIWARSILVPFFLSKLSKVKLRREIFRFQYFGSISGVKKLIRGGGGANRGQMHSKRNLNF